MAVGGLAEDSCFIPGPNSCRKSYWGPDWAGRKPSSSIAPIAAIDAAGPPTPPLATASPAAAKVALAVPVASAPAVAMRTLVASAASGVGGNGGAGNDTGGIGAVGVNVDLVVLGAGRGATSALGQGPDSRSVAEETPRWAAPPDSPAPPTALRSPRRAAGGRAILVDGQTAIRNVCMSGFRAILNARNESSGPTGAAEGMQ